jgi:CBS domain-containing protein
MKVREAMRPNPVTIKESCSVLEAARILVQNSVGGAPVVDEAQSLVGVVTEHDLLLALELVGTAVPVSTIMGTRIVAANPEDELDSVRQIFIEKRLRRMPVVEGKSVVGTLSRRDVLRAHLGLKSEGS